MVQSRGNESDLIQVSFHYPTHLCGCFLIKVFAFLEFFVEFTFGSILQNEIHSSCIIKVSIQSQNILMSAVGEAVKHVKVRNTSYAELEKCSVDSSALC